MTTLKPDAAAILTDLRVTLGDLLNSYCRGCRELTSVGEVCDAHAPLFKRLNAADAGLAELVKERAAWKSSAEWWNNACKSAWESRDAAGVIADTVLADLKATVEEKKALVAENERLKPFAPAQVPWSSSCPKCGVIVFFTPPDGPTTTADVFTAQVATLREAVRKVFQPNWPRRGLWCVACDSGDSRHKPDCWVPGLRAALAATAPKEPA